MKYVLWLWRKIVTNGTRLFLVIWFKKKMRPSNIFEWLWKKITVTPAWQNALDDSLPTLWEVISVKPKNCYKLQSLLTSMAAIKSQKSFRLVHTPYSFHPTYPALIFDLTVNNNRKWPQQVFKSDNLAVFIE